MATSIVVSRADPVLASIRRRQATNGVRGRLCFGRRAVGDPSRLSVNGAEQATGRNGCTGDVTHTVR